MENQENPYPEPNEFLDPQAESPSGRGMELSYMAIQYLREAAKWAKFLAVLAMIGLGIYLIIALFFLTGSAFLPFQNNQISSGVFSMMIFFLIIIIIAIYAFPIWWLFKFSQKVTDAINFKNTAELTEAFNFLKKHYRYIGILAIVGIVFYILALIGGIMGGILAAIANQ